MTDGWAVARGPCFAAIKIWPNRLQIAIAKRETGGELELGRHRQAVAPRPWAGRQATQGSRLLVGYQLWGVRGVVKEVTEDKTEAGDQTAVSSQQCSVLLSAVSVSVVLCSCHVLQILPPFYCFIRFNQQKKKSQLRVCVPHP